MSIPGVGNSTNIYGQIASGSRLNTAADGAAELSIVEKEDSEVRGLDAGSNNMQSQKELLNVADGAMGSINDSLQRMRELTLQASNSALMSSNDLASIQKEIEGLKQGIADTASQTTFNTKNILDGTNTSFSAASDASGGSTTVNTADATLQSLGIADFDVTSGSFSIDTIDKALSRISESRASGGAQTNGLDYAINYNSGAALNHIGAKSKLEDLDIPQAVEEKEKQRLLQSYALMMQKRHEEDDARTSRAILGN